MPRWKFFLLLIVIELVLITLCVSVFASDTDLFKTYRLNRYDITIQCLNGNKPLVINRLGTEIIVSCK